MVGVWERKAKAGNCPQPHRTMCLGGITIWPLPLIDGCQQRRQVHAEGHKQKQHSSVQLFMFHVRQAQNDNCQMNEQCLWKGYREVTTKNIPKIEMYRPLPRVWLNCIPIRWSSILLLEPEILGTSPLRKDYSLAKSSWTNYTIAKTPVSKDDLTWNKYSRLT